MARAFGAKGIGLTRTEHMFFDDQKIIAMREMILAKDSEGREKALAKLLPYQKADFWRYFGFGELQMQAFVRLAQKFSFGTNDLTQMTFGYSRDDIASFLPAYLEKKRYLRRARRRAFVRLAAAQAAVEDEA